MSSSSFSFSRKISSHYLHRTRKRRERERLLFLEEMKKLAGLSPEENIMRVMTELRNLLEFSKTHVPYYASLFKDLGKPPSYFTSSPERFSEFPVLTKEILVSEGDRLVSDLNLPGRFENSTGGSTGRPVTFLQDRVYFMKSLAAIDFSYEMCGYKPGDKALFLWGSDRDANSGMRGVRKMIANRLSNIRWVNMFGITERELAETAVSISSWQPDTIFAYTSSARLLASAFEEKGIPPLKNVSIQLTAETVTGADRKYISQKLGGDIFNRYGSREVGIMAHECSVHGDLHIFTPVNHVELGPEPADSVYRPVIVTSLSNRTMPLIRYATGDLAVPATGRGCSCGIGFPLMGHVTGRISDLIRTRTGKLFHGEYFTHLFYGEKKIARFQVEQTDMDTLVIRLETGKGDTPHDLITRLENRIHSEVDGSMKLVFECHEKLEPASSGKFRYTISNMDAGRSSGSVPAPANV